MCPWKGHLSFKVYSPNKPNKHGIKLYMVCESVSGYCSQMDVYTGALHHPNPVEEEEAYGKNFNAVMGLLRSCGFLNKGYKIYLDNYFSSPVLFDHLAAEDTMACGTVRLSRAEMPRALKDRKLEADGVIYRRRRNLLALKWKDKREVSVLSTMHRAEIGCTAQRRSRLTPVVKPIAVLEYTRYMGGVDRSDQMSQYFSVLRKTNKWWKKLTLQLLAILGANTFILWQKFGRGGFSHHDFVLSIVKSLIESANTAPVPGAKRGRKAVGPVPVRLNPSAGHFPCSIKPQPGASNMKPLRRCTVHKESGERKETRYMCEVCMEPLCIEPCFKRFHTLQDYRLPAEE
ncbi:piggyBac transposable element-derived protein 4-like [Gigantopelta aegis]|uniref:piggyBac transposable element-derived protein 4-like n=1 Tax=Gigantopelta aegis TaxID=1735272 RepID=UPI001B88A88C|nr:piggyBac transposable element-derived protein 4-like [Gigantopelta aegis]